jgi:hypothetical protein
MARTDVELGPLVDRKSGDGPGDGTGAAPSSSTTITFGFSNPMALPPDLAGTTTSDAEGPRDGEGDDGCAEDASLVRGGSNTAAAGAVALGVRRLQRCRSSRVGRLCCGSRRRAVCSTVAAVLLVTVVVFAVAALDLLR